MSEGTDNCPCELAQPCKAKKQATQKREAPTLKQLFSKNNLTSYIEAARTKPLTTFGDKT
jgi:hypothetical protein